MTVPQNASLIDKNQLLDALVNLYRSSIRPTPTETLSMLAALRRIQDGTYRRPIQQLRALLSGGDQTAYNRAKRHLPAITPCGTFWPRRGIAYLQRHGGIVHGDIDHLTDLEAIREQLICDHFTVYCFASPSATGMKMGVRIEPVVEDTAYKQAWQAVADYYWNEYSVSWDKSGKDISRLCYVSWDPDLYFAPDAPLFPVPGMVVAPRHPPRPAPRQHPRQLSPDRVTRYAEQATTTAVAMIDSSEPGNRHDYRLRAARLMGGYVAGGILSHDEAWSALAEAVARNTNDLTRSLRTIADGLAYGQAHPITAAQLEAERRDWLRGKGSRPRHERRNSGLQTIKAGEVRPWR